MSNFNYVIWATGQYRWAPAIAGASDHERGASMPYSGPSKKTVAKRAARKLRKSHK